MLTIEDEEYCAPRYDHETKGQTPFCRKWGLLHELHHQTIFVCFVICHFTACSFWLLSLQIHYKSFFNKSSIMHRLYFCIKLYVITL